MVTTNRGDYVMRFSWRGDDFHRDQFAARFAGPALPIPQVLGIGQVGDTWWCLSTRVAGNHLDDIDATQMSAVIPSLATMLIAMQAVDASGTTGYGGWDEHGNGRFASFADQLLEIARDNPLHGEAGWQIRLRHNTHAAAVLERGIEVLVDQVHYLSNDRHLIHTDMLNFNVNVEGDRISGIYDWGCAMWGDPVYDLAWFAFWEPWYPQWASVNLARTLVDRVGIDGDHPQERLNCCKLHIGIDHIRYNAFTENDESLEQVVSATARLLDEIT